MNAAAARILAVNAGSSSLKVATFRVQDSALREETRRTLDARDAAATVVALLDAQDAGAAPVDAVVHRVVHGGDEAHECVSLDAAQTARLRALSPLAPLHQPPALAIVDAVALARPGLAQFACLDTAFHATLSAVARTYALPTDIRARHPELRVYGFHGLSCRSVVERLRREGTLPARLVIAHLGSGASVTAVRDGASIATSMGFSALDGLPMATRPGRIDPGVLLYLLRQERLDVDALETMLYRKSGLLGLSGTSGDLRALQADDGAAARTAVDFFVQRCAQEIGALAATLDGIDLVVFTGGIGEHQPAIRERILAHLRFLGTTLQTRVMACDEETVMAEHACQALQAVR